MKLLSTKAMVASIMLAVCASIAAGQEPKPTPKPLECESPILKVSDVDRKVKVLTYPEPAFDLRDVHKYKNGTIVLRAVFCASGKVTDIKVTRSISAELDREAIRAARDIKFTPALKNGEKVSQWMTLEYHVTRW